MPHSQPTALHQTVSKFHLDPQYHISHWGSTILGDSTLCKTWTCTCRQGSASVTPLYYVYAVALFTGGFTHYVDAIMTTMASQITSLTVVYSNVYQAQIKENIKAPRHWPLCGEFPAQRASNAENVSIWWRYHGHISWRWRVAGRFTKCHYHYPDVIMSAMASQITRFSTVCSIVCSDADQRKHQSSASLAFVREIHRGSVNFPHKWPVTRKMFLFDDVIITSASQ